jgi:hypothetical protein
MGPGIDRDLGRLATGEMESEMNRGRADHADRAQGCLRFRIETFQGLRQAAIPFRLDRAKQVLRGLRIRFPDRLDRLIEVSEDPTDLLFEEPQARGPEGVDRVASLLAQGGCPEAIGDVEVAGRDRLAGMDQPRLQGRRIDGPGGAVRGRHGEEVKTFPFLVRREGHPEGQQEEGLFLGLDRVPADHGIRAETRFDQDIRDPVWIPWIMTGRIPSTASAREGHELLEKVAAGSDQLRLEIPAPFRVERDRERRGSLEVRLEALGELDPEEGVAFRHGRAEVRKGLEDEGPKRCGVAHAGTSSPTSRRASSFRSWIRS